MKILDSGLVRPKVVLKSGWACSKQFPAGSLVTCGPNEKKGDLDVSFTELKKSILKTKICTDSLLTSLESSRSARYIDVVGRHCTGHCKITT